MIDTNSFLDLLDDFDFDFNIDDFQNIVDSVDDNNLSTNSIVLNDATTTVEVGETTFEVQNIGRFNASTSINFSDRTDVGSHPDLYQFSLDRSNDLTISIDDLSADADLYIFDSAGEVVAVSDNPNTEAETWSGNLEPDTYSIGVVPQEEMNTDYSFSVLTGEFALSSNGTDTTGDPVIIEPGETINEALDFGAFDGDGWFTHTGDVGAGDSADLYQFTLTQSNDFNFVLDGLSADADLHLVDSDGDILVKADNNGTAHEILTASLPAGTYYLGVASYDSLDTSYNLSVYGGDNALSAAEVDEIFDPSSTTEFSLV